MDNKRNNLMRDLAIIIISILVSVILAKTEIIKELLTASQQFRILGSFLAGLFFTSAFTVAPATLTLATIAQANSIFLVAFFGGLGALIGDLIIFRFVKDRLSEDIKYLLKKTKKERWLNIFQSKLLGWLIPVLGAIVIASPLPDEMGITMMGLSKIKTAFFAPISFALNSLGILVIGLIAKSLI